MSTKTMSAKSVCSAPVWLVRVWALAFVSASCAEVATSRSPVKPTENVVFSIDQPALSGVSVRWRGNPVEDAADTDAGNQFDLCGMLPGARLQALTVRIGQGQAGSFNDGARGLPLILDFYSVDAATSEYTLLFRANAAMPDDAAPADYLTFHLAGKEIELSNGSYAYLIGSNREDADLANEPHRFRLSVHTSDTTPGCLEIRREGFFGVDADLGAPDPRPGPHVPPNQIGPASREHVFFLQATVPGGSPEVLSLDYAPGEGTFTIQYQSEPNVSYTVRRSGDLREWTLLPPTEPGAGEVMSYTDTPPPAATAQFYMLSGAAPGKLPDPLPLNDFEDDAAGWTTSNPGGTATEWQLGEEAYFFVDAMSGSNVWGTDLESSYLPDTHIVLHSPPIDLSGYESAVLHWAQIRYFDFPTDDVGMVNVVDVTSNVGETIHTAVATAEVPDWETVSAPLPAGFMGRTVRIEFVFQGDGTGEFRWSPGWLIDNVAVTVCP